MGLPINLHSRGSMPGPLSGGLVSMTMNVTLTNVAGEGRPVGCYIPADFKIAKIILFDNGRTGTDLTVSVGWTARSDGFDHTPFPSMWDGTLLSALDWDGNVNADNSYILGVGSEADTVITEANRLIPKDSWFKASFVSAAAGTFTAPFGCTLVGHYYGHAYDDPTDD